MTDGPTLRVLSLGGGTQSCALALMSAAGELPKLDHIVFADTQGELPETYAYLDYLRTVLEPAGIPLHVITAGNLEEHLLSDVPLPKNPTPPAHVVNPDGTRGRINQYRCSYDFKRRIIEQKVRQLCGGRGAWKRTTVEQWIGFSLEETARCKPAEHCRCGHNRTSRYQGQFTQIHAIGGGVHTLRLLGVRPLADEPVAAHRAAHEAGRHHCMVRPQRAPDAAPLRVLVLPQQRERALAAAAPRSPRPVRPSLRD